MRRRNQLLGPDARPVALPRADYDAARVKRAGNVELPIHIRWSAPRVCYNLVDRRDLIRVYEQVLREGTPDDIQEFIDVDLLPDIWCDLVLPPSVIRAWAWWFKDNRGVVLPC